MDIQRTSIYVALVALAWSALAVHAGVNTFTPTGPDGGLTYDIEFAAGNTLLVTTTRAMYRSTDGGLNWTRVREMESWSSRHLVANPANRNQVLLGGAEGLFRSTDGGATWNAVGGLPLQNNYVGMIEFSSDGAVAWMAQQNGGLIYRSTDGGATWTASDTGLQNPVGEMAVDTANPQLIYVMSADGSFRSADGGSTLAPLTFGGYLRAFTASSVANTALVYSHDAFRLFRTTDGGVNWNTTPWMPGPGRIIEFLQYVPGVAGKVWAVDGEFRMYRSVDDGDHWTELSFSPIGKIHSMAFDPADPTHIFIATSGGVFESTNDGDTWIERNRGLREGNSQSVLSSRAGTGAVYLHTRDLGSVHRRADNGAWNEVGRASSPVLGQPGSLNSWWGYSSLGVSQQDANRLYLVRDGKFGVSTDGGVNWTLLSTVPSVTSTMSVSPLDDRLIILGGARQNPSRSTDGGLTWNSPVVQGLPAAQKDMLHFAFDPIDANVVYAAVENYLVPEVSAVYKSVDGGVNFAPTAWNPAHNASLIWRLVHDPVRSNIVYVSSFHGLFKSVDGGASWTQLPWTSQGAQFGSGAGDLIIDPQSPDVLWASAWPSPWIARSVNGGASWDMMGDGEAFGQFTRIALVPGTRTRIVAQRWNGTREIDWVARMALRVDRAIVAVNAPTTSVFTVVNQGVFSASGLRLTATLPASSAAYSASSPGGTCTVTGTELSCDVASLAPGAQTAVTVGYTPTSLGRWSASLTSYEPDENTGDNIVALEITTPPATASSSGGGGGGRLDYLLLLMLGAAGVRRRSGPSARVRS